ncbi:hypothetical protein [Tsuneonella mangrovi]|uniref:hypothetical protein n=1 Tax=Tsuneonella mangrovi TaxID=1982042 RepID=UPI001471C65D|nr:hypothetical protein [Tsuneonella mangrovi]
MKRPVLFAFAAGCASLTLAGCANGYGSGLGYAYSTDYNGYGPQSYYGYYDGYYGPIYDGYWGSDGYFYYRPSSRENVYSRAERSHFSREPRSGGDWHEWRGQLRARHGDQMPHFRAPARRSRSRTKDGG